MKSQAAVTATAAVAGLAQLNEGDLTRAEKLGSAVDTALDITQEILALGVNPKDIQLLKVVKDVALSVIATQARLDAAALQAASAGGLGGLPDDDLDTRLSRALGRLDLLEAEEAQAIEAEERLAEEEHSWHSRAAPPMTRINSSSRFPKCRTRTRQRPELQQTRSCRPRRRNNLIHYPERSGGRDR